MTSVPLTSETSLQQKLVPKILEAEGPARLRLTARRPFDHIWLILIWFALLAIPFVASNAYVISLANMALINLILIASLNLLMGFGGQISLGHAGFFGRCACEAIICPWRHWAGMPSSSCCSTNSSI